MLSDMKVDIPITILTCHQPELKSCCLFCKFFKVCIIRNKAVCIAQVVRRGQNCMPGWRRDLCFLPPGDIEHPHRLLKSTLVSTWLNNLLVLISVHFTVNSWPHSTFSETRTCSLVPLFLNVRAFSTHFSCHNRLKGGKRSRLQS